MENCKICNNAKKKKIIRKKNGKGTTSKMARRSWILWLSLPSRPLSVVAGSTGENPSCAVLLANTLHWGQGRQWRTWLGFGCTDLFCGWQSELGFWKMGPLFEALLMFLFAFPLVSFLYKYHCFPGQLSNVLEQISRRGSGAFFEALLPGLIRWEFN